MRIGIDASRAFVNQLTGTERYAREMIDRILKLPEAKKHEWILYVRQAETAKNELGIQGLYPNARITEIPMKHLWTQAGLAARTWKDGLDILWVPAHTLPLLRRGVCGIGRPLRTVVTVHGIEYEWLPAYENRLQRWYLPLSTIYAVRAASYVVAVSQFTRDQLIKRLKADPGKIGVIWEGYDAADNGGGNKENPKVLMGHKLKKNKYFVFVGTVQPRKNLPRLIEAFLKLKHLDYKLVICGKLGWNYAKELEMVESREAGGRVVLAGYLNDRMRRQLLSGASAYIQPSITEGFGLPVLEAMEAGVPVLSSNGGALPEILGGAGLTFDPFDVRQITAAMEQVIGDGKLRQRLVERGKKRISDFKWETAAKKMLKVLTYKL